MAKLNEKKVAAVKKLAQGGPGQKIKEKADRVTQGLQGYFSGRENAIKGAFGPTASGVASNVVSGMKQKATTAQGKGGQTMGGKATTAKGKGGPTMGQKAAVAQGKGGPIVQAIKEKLTGKPTDTSAPAEKQEPLKLSTFNLPTVVRVGNQGYDPSEVFGVAKKIEQTYGRDSEQFKQFAAGVGLAPTSKGWGFPGIDVRKPDLRKDTKSYVDTAQKEYGISTNPMYAKQTYSLFGGKIKNQDPYTVGKMIKYAADMLEEFGAKSGKRLLSQDEKGYEKNAWGGIKGYYE